LVRRRGLGTFVADAATQRRTSAPRGQATIACIVNGLHGLRGAHLAHILITLEAICTEQGYQLVLLNSAESTEREEDALRRAHANGVSGIILYPVQGSAHPNVFAEVRRHQVPLVMIDRYRPDVPTDAVVADNSDLGYQLTTRLIARGHERIATLWGETEATSATERQAGHVHALRDHQLPIRPDLAVLRPYESLPENRRISALRKLLESSEPPTVLLCGNGYVLTAAADDLSALGLRVPEDIQLACMDDTGPYDLLRLAVVEGVLPSEEMARKAMGLLVQRMTSNRPYGRAARRIVLPVGIHEREVAPR
jgi:DNA-binding LacI/PurR family transcriptional regulator